MGRPRSKKREPPLAAGVLALKKPSRDGPPSLRSMKGARQPAKAGQRHEARSPRKGGEPAGATLGRGDRQAGKAPRRRIQGERGGRPEGAGNCLLGRTLRQPSRGPARPCRFKSLGIPWLDACGRNGAGIPLFSRPAPNHRFPKIELRLRERGFGSVGRIW
ncbi:MAG: hypothetical protein M2R45_04093 [Verrucomicrobia subdivision 3 bacterium]|nr:hypothetical protein [Limisphaerales bacterium]MCS1417106.1 hypothetical protein [Limisphaerales bacterium]